MSDVLLPLLPTLVLAAYLFYVIFCESAKQSNSNGKNPVAPVTDKAKPAEEMTSTTVRKSKPNVAVAPAKIAQKPVELVIKTEEKPATVERVTQDMGMPDYYRNPKTDELAPVPNNYRFAKRWIKKALVEEGLLGKIYRNNEMTPSNSKKVKKALEALAKLPQYRG